MNVMIIGGERSGQFVDVLEGSRGWVDIRTGTTFQVARLDWAVQDPGPDGLPVVRERWRLRIAVHPDIVTHEASGQIVQQAVQNMAMTYLCRAEAEPLPLDTEKAPDTPSALFGPDGRPV